MPTSPRRTRLSQVLSRHWTGRLAPYRLHRHDEHREALIDEALRFVGFQLESMLAGSDYWSAAPLARRASILLLLVDRGVLTRRVEAARVVFEVAPSAEAWVASQPAFRANLEPLFELLAALRDAQARFLLAAD